MKWKVAVTVILLAVGVGTAGFVIISPGGSGSTQYLTSAVIRTTVARQVAASGSVRWAAIYDLAFGASPVLETGVPASASSGATTWVVKRVAVKPGDRVTKGAILATADTAAAAASLALAKASLAVAQARLAVDKAGPSAADRASAYDAIVQAQQQLSLAKQSQADTARQSALRLSQAQQALQAAQAKLAADQAAGPPTATLQADQAAITQAQQQVDMLTLQNQAAAGQASALAQQNALKLSQAQQALQLAQAQLARDSIPVPVPSSSPLPPDPAKIAADQAAVIQAQQQLALLTLQNQASDSQASALAQQNALKLSQAQQALQAAQAKLAADQAAGPPTATLQADQAAITQAQQQLDTLTLQHRSSLDQAAGQIAAASLSLSIAQHGYASKVVGATASVLASDAAALVSAQESVRQAQLTLDGATLRSPFDGVVTAVNVVAGAAAPAAPDVAVAVGGWQVTGTVTETDLPSLRVGQAANVAISALGATAAGTLLSIGLTGSISGSSGVVSYPIVIALNAAPPGTAAGMSAQIAVTTAQAPGVLAVPSVALAGSPGQYTVRVLDAAGRPHDRTVQVGLVTSTLAEIKSGLTEGERVVTGTAAPQTGTSSSGGGLPGLLPGGGGGGGGQQ